MKFTTNDCIFAVVCSLNDKVYQVKLSSDKIKELIISEGKFEVYEGEIQGLKLEIRK